MCIPSTTWHAKCKRGANGTNSKPFTLPREGRGGGQAAEEGLRLVALREMTAKSRRTVNTIHAVRKGSEVVWHIMTGLNSCSAIWSNLPRPSIGRYPQRQAWPQPGDHDAPFRNNSRLMTGATSVRLSLRMTQRHLCNSHSLSLFLKHVLQMIVVHEEATEGLGKFGDAGMAGLVSRFGRGERPEIRRTLPVIGIPTSEVDNCHRAHRSIRRHS